jgi:hypothetical protein
VDPSDNQRYKTGLFQSQYYDEQAQNASADRSKQNNPAAADASTLDMFKEQAKKDGLYGSGEDAAEVNKNASADAPADDAVNKAVTGAGADFAANAPGGGAKLQSAGGFGSIRGGGGGSNSSMPKLSGGGGMFGGINGQFAPVYKAPAGQQGKTSAMKGSMASVVKGSHKYSVPNKGKGAYGQAQFAGKRANSAAYSADASGARTEATEAFSGETNGSGDVGVVGTGAGIKGAGISNGPTLKNNDPNLNLKEITPPPAAVPEDVTPWTKWTEKAMKYMIASFVGILLVSLFAKIAKAVPFMYYAALLPFAAAVFAAGMVIYAGYMLMKGDPQGSPPWTGQTTLGAVYMAVGAVLILKAWNALCDMAGQDDVGKLKDGTKVTGTFDKAKGTMTYMQNGNSMTSAAKLTSEVPNWMSKFGGLGLTNLLSGL